MEALSFNENITIEIITEHKRIYKRIHKRITEYIIFADLVEIS